MSFSCTNISDCLAQRDNYEAVFNSMNEGLCIVGYDQVVTMCNKPFFSITGLTRREVLNRKIADIFCENRTCGLLRAVEKTVRTGRPCRDEAMDIVLRDGSRIPAVFSTSILRTRQGDEGIVVLFRDVSREQELKKQLHERYQFHQLIGKNTRMQEIYQLIEDVAATDAYVLIQGRSGTGKELVANAIHYHSRRAEGPFVKVSCAALSANVLESELFGHVKGAFTGAYRDKPGRFERAHGGTVFLDEIGEVDMSVQVKLLRVLQEKEIERVGDTRTRRVDVRVIAATNRDLQQLVRQGDFREDLYYRLKVVTIDIPPLKERREDIPLLVDHFIGKYNRQYHKQVACISQSALDVLMEHDWLGNIRELENVIEHAFVKTRTDTLLPDDFPHEIRSLSAFLPSAGQGGARGKITRATLLQTLQETGWNQARAARRLGIDRVTVWRNIRKYEIAVPKD